MMRSVRRSWTPPCGFDTVLVTNQVSINAAQPMEGVVMIRGLHAMFYSSQAKELRAFLRDKLVPCYRGTTTMTPGCRWRHLQYSLCRSRRCLARLRYS